MGKGGERVFDGGCGCGAVRYRARAPRRELSACHCSLCRRQSGHYWASTDAWKGQVAITGEADLIWHRSSATGRRGFCRRCGAFLFFDDGGETLSIGAGTFDPGHDMILAAHIFVADKGSYYELEDDLPRFPKSGHGLPMPPRAGADGGRTDGGTG